MATKLTVRAFRLQDTPTIICAGIPGRWLVDHSTPSWRIKDPVKGFQRMVREERAREIARAVLDQGRSFPNAIVLATDRSSLEIVDGRVSIPGATKFLVVDGQHRLWSQRFSEHEARYACLIHPGLSEVQMAHLFLEINDNQKRVPSSLRWDLVRLVRPDDDPHALAAAELVYDLATVRASPLYQRIDLTGEQGEIELKQGSIAPEIKSLVGSRGGAFRKLNYEDQYEALARYLLGVRSVDPSDWRKGTSPLGRARVLRALLRLLPHVAESIGRPPNEIAASQYQDKLKQIDRESLAPDRIRAVQGAAGIKEITEIIAKQLGIKVDR